MKKRKITIYQLCVIAMMTALLCVLAPMSVPIGPVPITLATMVIYFMVYVLGPWMGTCSVCLYIFLGAIGLPVFSGFVGGLGKLAGPTGGYIAGYILMAFVGGIIIKKLNIICGPQCFRGLLEQLFYIHLEQHGLCI